MNNRINVEEVIKKHTPHGIQNIKGKGDGKPQYRAEIQAIKDVVKEIVEAIIDKCAEEATITIPSHIPVEDHHWIKDYADYFDVDRQSILEIKKLVDYD